MKKFLCLLCIVAVLAVAYLAFTQSRGGEAPTVDAIASGTEEIADQVRGMYQEYGSAALEQVDERLGDAVEQADEAIGEAVESAVEGAKEGFLQSIKKSIADFWEKLTSS